MLVILLLLWIIYLLAGLTRLNLVHLKELICSIALVLTPDIFDILRNQPAGSGGENQLADAINTQAQRGNVEAVRLKGLRFDCGSVDGYLDAIMHVAEQRRRG